MTDWQKAREAAEDALEFAVLHSDCVDSDVYLDAALSAFEEAGFVLVPKEAGKLVFNGGYVVGTKEFKHMQNDSTGYGVCECARMVYDAMIAAAIAERQK